MRAEHLKGWFTAFKREKKEAATTTEGGRPETAAAQEGTESENWTRVVDLIQAAFREGKLS